MALEDNCPIRSGLDEWMPIQAYLAGSWSNETRYEVKDRGLSAPGRPQDAEKLLVGHVEAQALKSYNRAIPMGVGHRDLVE